MKILNMQEEQEILNTLVSAASQDNLDLKIIIKDLSMKYEVPVRRIKKVMEKNNIDTVKNIEAKKSSRLTNELKSEVYQRITELILTGSKLNDAIKEVSKLYPDKSMSSLSNIYYREKSRLGLDGEKPKNKKVQKNIQMQIKTEPEKLDESLITERIIAIKKERDYYKDRYESLLRTLNGVIN